MNNSAIFFFILIFSTLTVLRYLINAVISIISPIPQRVEYNDKQLLILGVSISYILTYILYS
jgi:hypothetical protein